MPKRLHPQRICHACRLHFHGDSLTDIAVLLDSAPTTLTRWKKTQISKDFEVSKLIDEWKPQQTNIPKLEMRLVKPKPVFRQRRKTEQKRHH